MGIKTKKQIEEDIDFEKRKATIYQAAKENFFSLTFEEDRLFAVLVVCGYPAAAAYRIAYPMSRANQASSAVLASRRLQEPEVQQFISGMINKFNDGYLTINTACYKGKTKRRPKWMGAPCTKFEPPTRKFTK